MITDKDIVKLKQVFATKDDLKNFATKDDLNSTVKDLLGLIHAFRTELKGNIADLRHDMVSFKDDVITEIRAVRQEQDILTGYRDKIEDHEERIVKLESHSN